MAECEENQPLVTQSREFSSITTLNSEGIREEEYGAKTTDNFTAWPYGFQHKTSYDHNKNAEILGVCYNGRMKQFVILDNKGVTTWSKDALEQNVRRAMNYPKYEYRLITNFVYAPKYNVYFALGKDFSLKVLNRDFEETCSVSSDMRSVLFMLFNPVRDELITGGVGGTQVWTYHQVADKTWTDIKPMANYRLTLKHELEGVGGSWVKRVELEQQLQHLYCCSDTDLYCYNMDGNLLFHFERAHTMSISGCAYSRNAKLLVTASVDTEVKVWSITGGLVHTFRGHSRAVSNLLLHPDSSSLVLTSSLDGSIRMWSLDTMDCIYSIVVSTEGVLWMGLTDDRLLYMATIHTVSLWSLNNVTFFWALARSRINQLSLVHGEGKSTRVLAVGGDSSVRLFSRKTQANLSTVLPPPPISPFQQVLGVAYNRVVSVVFVLIDTKEVWVYTTRTDPASRIAVWDVLQIQEEIFINNQQQQSQPSSQRISNSGVLLKNRSPLHRATPHGQGNEGISECRCVCYLNSPAMMYTEEGLCCPLRHNYLLIGLEDGRILFMDPVVKGKKYFEFRAHKDAIVSIKHETIDSCLLTECDLGECHLIQVWNLPSLELQHEVFCPSDITGFVRLGSAVFTGHRSGTVIQHQLLALSDTNMTYRFKGSDDDNSVYYDTTKAEHRTPVIAIDACPSLGLFCTCSPDGSIKIWNENKLLVTEVSLDDTLCAACFLNKQGDLLVGFRNHIFVIEHSKIAPNIEVTVEDSMMETESDIYEDPAVKYEGVVENPDPIDLQNYLVPFEMDFSKDFIEGKKSAVPLKETIEDDDDTVSELSAAPTDIYASPTRTPRSLSQLDLTLKVDATPYELNKHMERMMLHTTGGRSPNLQFSAGVLDSDDEPELCFHLPHFGISPGPTPSPSPPTTIATPSSCCSVSEDGDSSPCLSDREIITPKPIQKVTEKPTGDKKISVDKKVVKADVKETQLKSRISEMRINAHDLIQKEMKKMNGDKIALLPKEADHSHANVQDYRAKAIGRKPLKKKEIEGPRKRPIKKTGRRTSVASSRRRSSVARVDPGLLEKGMEKAPVMSKGRRPTVCRSSMMGVHEESDVESESEVELNDIHGKAENIPKAENIMHTTTSIVSPGAEPGVPAKKSKTSSKPQRTHMIIAIESNEKPSVCTSPTEDLKTNVPGIHSATLVNTDVKISAIATQTAVASERTTSLYAEDDMEEEVILTDNIPPSEHMEMQSLPKTPASKSEQTHSELLADQWDLARAQSRHGSRARSSNVYSKTPSVYSDHGSEWPDCTEKSRLVRIMEGMEEDERSRLENMLDKMDENEQHQYVNHLIRVSFRQKRLSKSARMRTTTPAESILNIPWRPLTAEVTPYIGTVENLEDEFEDTLREYLGIPGSYRFEYNEPLYKKDGIHFNEDWEIKQLKRHKLLQMQKMLRMRRASERRAVLALRKKQQSTTVPAHVSCYSNQGAGSGSDPKLIAKLQEANATELSAFRCKSGLKNKESRQQSTSSHSSLKNRPQTAAAAQRSWQKTNTTVPKRPATAGYFNNIDDQKSQSSKSELQTERPFRGRIYKQSKDIGRPASSNSKTYAAESFDIRWIDPRLPESRFSKEPSKSIPSKCGRYILVSHAKQQTSEIVPTPLEEHLIPERFPVWGDRWLKETNKKPDLIRPRYQPLLPT